jgi:hypothetical protein
MMMVLVFMIVIDGDGYDDVDDIVHNGYPHVDNNGDNVFESDRWR